MNKIIIATIASALLTMYLIKRRKKPALKYQPVQQKAGNSDKHITDIFARAKKTWPVKLYRIKFDKNCNRRMSEKCRGGSHNCHLALSYKSGL